MATKRKLITAPVSLREAIRDPRLLALNLSAKQNELAGLVELNEVTIGACGRQSGKTLIGAAALVHNLCLRPDLDGLASGLRNGLCIANSKEQAGIVLGYARRLIEASPLLRAQLVAARDDRLVFKNGSIVAMPCADRLLRGLVASIVICDEFAHFVTETDGPRAAEKVWSAVRPSLITFGGEARTLVISTPVGDNNLFATLYQRASNGEMQGAVAFRSSTVEMNPHVTREFLENEHALLGPQDFEREFEAAFTGGGAGFMERAAIDSCVGRHRELAADQGTSWIVGFDPSFSIDPSAAAVVGRSKSNHEQLIVARIERWAPPRPSRLRRRQSVEGRAQVKDSVLDAVAALSRAFGDATVLSDQHVPTEIKEGLRARGVPRVITRPWTGETQTAAFRDVRGRIYSGRITLPNDPQLVAELARIRTKVRSGGSQIEIPRSGGDHCDSAVALASAVHELERRGVHHPLRTSSAVAGGARSAGRRRRARTVRQPGIVAGAEGTYTSTNIDGATGMPVYSPQQIEQLNKDILSGRRRRRFRGAR